VQRKGGLTVVATGPGSLGFLSESTYLLKHPFTNQILKELATLNETLVSLFYFYFIFINASIFYVQAKRGRSFSQKNAQIKLPLI
jgi:hypothetical protein